MSKVGLHEPFEHLQHKLWQKERPGVKVIIWLPTIKSRELTWPWYVQVECDTLLESSWQKLQLCFRPHPNPRFEQRVLVSQSCGSPKRGNFRFLFGSSGTKSHSDLGAAERCKEYYMGEGGGFPRARAVVSLVSPESSVACPSTKNAPESELTNLLVGLMQIWVSN
jgi:hypothetical protein